MVDMIHDLRLQPLLQPGTITWEHQTQDLSRTVDVVLASIDLAEEKLRCQVYGTDHGSDHKAIKATFTLGSDNTHTNAPGRLLLGSADWNKINNHLQATLRPCRPGGDARQLDEEAEYLIKTVTDTLQ